MIVVHHEIRDPLTDVTRSVLSFEHLLVLIDTQVVNVPDVARFLTAVTAHHGPARIVVPFEAVMALLQSEFVGVGRFQSPQRVSSALLSSVTLAHSRIVTLNRTWIAATTDEANLWFLSIPSDLGFWVTVELGVVFRAHLARDDLRVEAVLVNTHCNFSLSRRSN